ncbi:MAG: hypothetical protein DI568_10120 [Sphingomonas sp.]|nr:MAG: hypothetical protein DI568_10120 [Sphingomonas sp.]
MDAISPMGASGAKPLTERQQAAQAFEAMMLRQLLQPIVPSDGAGSLALDALAGKLAATAPFGLARLIGDAE